MEFILRFLGLFALAILLYGIYSRLDTIAFIISKDSGQTQEGNARQDSGILDSHGSDSINKKNMRLFLAVIFGVILGIGVVTYLL